jgi:hypothetical protein
MCRIDKEWRHENVGGTIQADSGNIDIRENAEDWNISVICPIYKKGDAMHKIQGNITFKYMLQNFY